MHLHIYSRQQSFFKICALRAFMSNNNPYICVDMVGNISSHTQNHVIVIDNSKNADSDVNDI